jgi:Phosphotransferase enzyme family
MTAPVPPIPSDPGLPGARGLFGQDGVRLVSEFLDRRGWELDNARPVQALYHPGRSMIVRHRVSAEGSSGKRSLTVCIETRSHRRRAVPVPEAFAERHGIPQPVERRDNELVWAFPYDPSLSGVPHAVWGPDVRDALAESGTRPAAISVEPLRYRPRRRAVFRYRALHLERGGRRWETSFGKVLPRDKAERTHEGMPWLRRAARLLPLTLPSARLGSDGLVFPVASGRSLRDLLIRGGSLPAPSRVAALLSSLARAIDPAEPGVERPAPPDLARSGAEVIERLVPSAAAQAARVRDAVESGAASDPGGESIVHGDLYEAQVFVDERFALGLIDLDDLGRGDPVLDAANFCAHLLALALAVPRAADRLVAYRRLVRPAFLRALDVSPEAMAWREALSMLLLAAGPFRVLDPAWPAEVGRRVALAVRLLEEP